MFSLSVTIALVIALLTQPPGQPYYNDDFSAIIALFGLVLLLPTAGLMGVIPYVSFFLANNHIAVLALFGVNTLVQFFLARRIYRGLKRNDGLAFKLALFHHLGVVAVSVATLLLCSEKARTEQGSLGLPPLFRSMVRCSISCRHFTSTRLSSRFPRQELPTIPGAKERIPLLARARLPGIIMIVGFLSLFLAFTLTGLLDIAILSFPILFFVGFGSYQVYANSRQTAWAGLVLMTSVVILFLWAYRIVTDFQFEQAYPQIPLDNLPLPAQLAEGVVPSTILILGSLLAILRSLRGPSHK